jgi:hypothetical protein
MNTVFQNEKSVYFQQLRVSNLGGIKAIRTSMLNIFTLLTILFSLPTYADELKFEKIYFNRDTIEMSGLVKKGNDLLFVGDKLSNRSIYKIVFEKERFYYKDYINLSDLSGHKTYFTKALIFKHGGRIVKSPFDLEGLSFCGNDFYLVNEQVRHLLKVSKNKIHQYEIDFESAFKKLKYPMDKIATNAGFEGVAIDCKNNLAYIAQERSPRGIFQIDLKTQKITDSFLFNNKETKNGSNDYADLYFENGFLYLLERNNHLITKYSIKEKKIVASMSFGKLTSIHLRELYKTGEPYGLAEGLTMSKDQIYIGIDNNGNPISKKGIEAYKIKGNFSSLLIYQRPKDF